MLYNIGHQQFTPRAEYTGVVRHKGKQMSTSNDTVYIYALQRISDKAFLYIGSAKNPQLRFNHHRHKNRYAVIREAFAQNDIRYLVITSTDELHRLEVETNLWKQFKNAGHPIVNRNPSIAWSCFAHSVSQETRAKMSASRIGKKMPPRTPEHSAKIAAFHRGRKLSEEHKRKVSESGKGRIVSEATREKLRIANLGKKHTPATCAKLSEINKGKQSPRKGVKLTDEQKLHLSVINQGKHHTQETRDKMSKSRKGKPHPCKRKANNS